MYFITIKKLLSNFWENQIWLYVVSWLIGNYIHLCIIRFQSTWGFKLNVIHLPHSYITPKFNILSHTTSLDIEMQYSLCCTELISHEFASFYYVPKPMKLKKKNKNQYKLFCFQFFQQLSFLQGKKKRYCVCLWTF